VTGRLAATEESLALAEIEEDVVTGTWS